MSSIETAEAIQANGAAQERLRMSYAEWLAWDYQGSLTEWIDGEVIVMSPPSVIHQAILVFLGTLLTMIVGATVRGQILLAPVGMRLHMTGPVREPDMIYVTDDHRDRFTQRQLEGPADLAIEIISDESVNRDRVDKFYEYQDGGVREYWIIDPREGRQRVDLYVLDETGRYQPVPPEVGGIYRSVVIPGFWLREAWLWQENPNALAALTEVVGVERMVEAIRQSS